MKRRAQIFGDVVIHHQAEPADRVITVGALGVGHEGGLVPFAEMIAVTDGEIVSVDLIFESARMVVPGESVRLSIEEADVARKAGYEGPPERLEAYDSVLELVGVARKGVATPYTSLNGWMTSFLDVDGSLSLRLAAADRSEFIESFDALPAIQYGKEMKEFLVVPADVLNDTELMAVWFRRSLDWVATLRPKPTRRRGGGDG